MKNYPPQDRAPSTSRRFRRVLSRIGLALAVAIPLAAHSAELVWQLGNFDATAQEFANRRSGPAADGPYVIGSSDPATDWEAFQPIERPGAKPRTIQ